jgi:tetratricopeptide (TPR) repeat protein
MTDRLLATDRGVQQRPLPESVAPPYGTWTRSTAQHLAHWAIFLSRLEGEKGRSIEEIRALVERALQVSPLNPTARLAAAQLETPGPSTTVSIRSLGLSRDVQSLAFSARKLLAAGQKDAALRLYGQSLAVAIPGKSCRAPEARFSDDPSVPRYLLPGEEPIREIVRELASRNDWTKSEWLAILPDDAVVRLIAARLLREQGLGDADALLELVLNEQRPAATPGAVGPLTLAARAEAFALRSRWREAESEYRQAIELIDDDTIKRSWWFNLADIASRLDDDQARQSALRAALAVASSDDISRRATEAQRAARPQPATRSTGVKAN